jgi:hypothetical protein
MKTSLVFYSLLSLSLSLHVSSSETRESNKRKDDEPRRLPSVAGGGRNSRSKSAKFPRENREDTELLQFDSPSSPLPDTYTFLADPRYRLCRTDEVDPQGSCNTCWAFATQKMVQARTCKWRADKGEEKPLIQLTPINLICKVQDKVGGLGLCDPKSLQDSLDYARNEGILTTEYFKEWSETL